MYRYDGFSVKVERDGRLDEFNIDVENTDTNSVEFVIAPERTWLRLLNSDGKEISKKSWGDLLAFLQGN